MYIHRACVIPHTPIREMVLIWLLQRTFITEGVLMEIIFNFVKEMKR
jgi:hypothetical protein